MCYSKADGGQRCYPHTRAKYDKAVAAHRRHSTPATEEALLEAASELASTPRGEKELVEQEARAYQDGDLAAFQSIAACIARGKAMREKAAAVRDAVKDAERDNSYAKELDAKAPSEVDTILSDLYQQAAEARRKLGWAEDYARAIARQIKQREDRTVRVSEPSVTDALAILEGHENDRVMGSQARNALTEYRKWVTEIDRIKEAETPLHDAFRRRGGWERAFLVTNQNGHVHSSMACSTCTPTTLFAWQPQLSGRTEKEIVEEAGELACTVCYPSAPADVLNRPSRIVSVERQERDRKRAERAAARSAQEQAKIENSVTGDGTEFEVVYGQNYDGSRLYREKFKTERSAMSWAVRAYGEYGPGNAWGMELDDLKGGAVQSVKDAIAAKHGWSAEQMEEHFTQKVQAWRRRNR